MQHTATIDKAIQMIDGLAAVGQLTADGKVTDQIVDKLWADLFPAAQDYVFNYRGSLSFIQDLQRRGFAKRSVGQVRGVMNCVLAECRRERSKAEEAAGQPGNEHVGAVGERMDLELTVTYCKVQYDPDQDRSHWDRSEPDAAYTMVKFVDAAGHRFTWFGSGNHGDLSVGLRVAVRGTVKRHTEFNGWNETQLTRCKVAIQAAA